MFRLTKAKETMTSHLFNSANNSKEISFISHWPPWERKNYAQLGSFKTLFFRKPKINILEFVTQNCNTKKKKLSEIFSFPIDHQRWVKMNGIPKESLQKVSLLIYIFEYILWEAFGELWFTGNTEQESFFSIFHEWNKMIWIIFLWHRKMNVQ